MKEPSSVIVVIPARGGSKGIPKKNLRPMAGKPLIAHVIKAALGSRLVDHVFVSTDDDEIALTARQFNAQVLNRPKEYSDDVVTLDEVINHEVSNLSAKLHLSHGVIVTIQPTSPLLTAAEIDEAIEQYLSSDCDTLVSATDDRHLTWTEDSDGNFIPEYSSRINRQQLPPRYKETGAFVICSFGQASTGSRFGKKISLSLLPPRKSLDIDTFEDFALCEHILTRKKIAFVVIGYDEVGMGHVYRCLMLAHSLVNYDVVFFTDAKSSVAYNHISKMFFNVISYRSEDDLLTELEQQQVDLVINDRLDTETGYIRDLKKMNMKVVNFEDLGSGAYEADLTFNALYPHLLPEKSILVGEKYFCLRDEFIYQNDTYIDDRFENILITFGGTDPNNITYRCCNLLVDFLAEQNVRLTVILGPGYIHDKSKLEHLLQDSKVPYEVHSSVSTMSECIADADLVITSGGRTVYEVVSIGRPVVVICQNQRESTHSFASPQNGVINMGLHSGVSDMQFSEVLDKIFANPSYRRSLVDKQKQVDLKSGKARVIGNIIELLEK